MPELPEVAVLKRYMDSTALHKKIAGVEVRDSQVLANISAETFRSRLSGQEFSSTSRRGKYLFVHLENDVLVMHFGMTGDLRYYKNPGDEPDFTQVMKSYFKRVFIPRRRLTNSTKRPWTRSTTK